MIWIGNVALFGLICLVGQTAARDIFAIIHVREHYSQDKLNRKLEEKELCKHDGINYAQCVAHKVANLLASTKKKYHVGTVLNIFSVDEVLHLNHYDFSACSMTEFGSRVELCNKLRINENMHLYCSACNDHVDFNCLLNKEIVYKQACKMLLPQDTILFLEDFVEKVIKVSKKLEGELKDNLEEAVKTAIAKSNRLTKLRVHLHCRKFNEAVADLYHVKKGIVGPSQTGEADYTTIHASCMIVSKQETKIPLVSDDPLA